VLTTDFDQFVRDRLRRDPTFREALLAEAAKGILDHIEARLKAAREEHKQRYGKEEK
jgi:hypothetical protein